MPSEIPLNFVEPKDPDETKLFTMDWTDALVSGTTISSSTWSLPDGLTNVADAIVTGSLKTSIRVSGGTADVDYRVINTVQISNSETLQRTGVVSVRSL